ncbi:MAG: AbrB family transcriptional regulator [Proteobacteria bacterium HN_bin10]|nr:MAG: AbrB family transcriptional regulator [Proteobacteria bacterium HN_bin10]
MGAVTVKGQVTIPKPVRDKLGLKAGDEVAFEAGPDGAVIIRKARGKPKPSRFENLRGRAGKGLSTAQIMALTRGE